MNVYAKMVIIGAIGLTVIAIILGIAQPGRGAEISINEGAVFDILVLMIILELDQDDPLRTILLVLWFLGFFTLTSEE